VAPLIVREIDGADGRDAVSPYGYPGIVPGRRRGLSPLSPGRRRGLSPLSPDEVDWSATGLVSIFVRGTALGPHMLAGREVGTLQISDPALKRKSRPSDRQQIRRNEADGYAVRVRPGPETTEDDRAGFRRVYEQTMLRAEASERYFFDREWFDATLSSPRTWLATVTAPGGGIAAASIAALSDAALHYFLSGTADEHLRDAPMKNLIAALQDVTAELGAPLNLGGGLRPGDGLEEFKRGFANSRAPFVTYEIVCDRDAYERLSAGRSVRSGDSFPAYRAPP
jgi:Acetyltransferase (GNAT) domain